jgi:hypothetical protein
MDNRWDSIPHMMNDGRSPDTRVGLVDREEVQSIRDGFR